MGEETGATVRDRLLGVIAIVLIADALHRFSAVLLPIIIAVFVIAAAWPIKKLSHRLLPGALSYAITVLSLLAILAAFAATLWYSLGNVWQTFSSQEQTFHDLFEHLMAWAQAHHLPFVQGDALYGRLRAVIAMFVQDLYSGLSFGGSVAVIVILGFPEVPALARRVHAQFGTQQNREIFDAASQIATAFRLYAATTILTSLLTGVAVGVFCWVMGLHLAFTWGILNFLLNFIPVIGNIIGIAPPVLFALVQFDGLLMPTLILIGLGVIQMIISNFVYPLLQGRSMSMPPLTVILSLLLWGWLLGIGGALVAIPLTAAIIIVCRTFAATRKFANILSSGNGNAEQADDI